MFKLRYIWLFIGLFLAYSFWPAYWPSCNINYDEPNHLKIRFQECGCPCPEAVIEKGSLLFSDSIKQTYPTLNEKSVEINLVNFEPVNNKNWGNGLRFDFLSSNDFNIMGAVIAADTVACSPDGCELSPVFKVTNWEIRSYYPRFWLLNSWCALLCLLTLLIGVPILTIITIRFKKHF